MTVMSAHHIPHSSEISAIGRLFQSIDQQFQISQDQVRHPMPLDLSHLTITPSRFDDLPLEVIQKIFIACLPKNDNPIISLEHAPLLLTQVSANWRRIAAQTPQLWSSIHISPLGESLEDLLFNENEPTVDTELEDDAVEYSKVIDHWLGTSSAHPLNISYTDLAPNKSPGPTTILSDIVLKHSARIEKLNITMNEPVVSSLELIRPHEISLLQTLRIKFLSSNAELSRSCSGLLQAPRLRSLDLRRISVPITELTVSWDQLTHLSLREQHDALSPVHLALADVGRVLRSAKHLVSCEVEIYSTLEEASPRDIITEPIFMPHLRRMAIHEHDGDLKSYFSLLDTPHLEHLEFYTDASAIPRPLLTVLPFMERMSDQLQSFATNLVRFSAEDFTKALRSCPHLSSLSIKSFDRDDGETHRSSFMMASVIEYQRRLPLDDKFLQLFMKPDTSGTYLVPNLNRMQLLDGFKFSRDAVVEFINFKQKRVVGVQPIESLTLRRGEGPEGRLDLDLTFGGVQSEDLHARLEPLYNS